MTVTIRRPPREPVRQGGEARLESAPIFELWTLDLRSGEAERAESFWNVGAVLAGPSGVFALAHGGDAGRLRKLSGSDKWTDFGPSDEYRRIVAVARDVLWLVDAGDRLVAVDAKTGRPRFRTELAGDAADAVRADPTTGDLAHVYAGGFGWIHADDGRTESMVEAK